MPKAFDQFTRKLHELTNKHDVACPHADSHVPMNECPCLCYEKQIFAAGWFMGRGVAPKKRILNQTERNERPEDYH